MRFTPVVIIVLLLVSCSKGITKILKNPDPEYKLRIAEKYFVQKKKGLNPTLPLAVLKPIKNPF